MVMVPEIILHNAKVYTGIPHQRWTEAISTGCGRIMAIGPSEEILATAGPKTTVIDCGKRLILPGLCDSHIHLYHWSLSRQQLQLDGCSSQAQLLERVAGAVAAHPSGTWVIGHGWNESQWDTMEFPTADLIDLVTGPDYPTLLWRSDFHSAVANHAALALAGIGTDTLDPEEGVIDRDALNYPTGMLREKAIDLVASFIPVPSGEELLTALEDAIRELHTLGITAIHDQRMLSGNETLPMLQAYRHLHQTDKLRLRVNCNLGTAQLPHLRALGIGSGFGNDNLRFGHIKFFSDGSLGSRTALMLEPYNKTTTDEADNFGISMLSAEQMRTSFMEVVHDGFPVSIHAIGDQANRTCLDLLEEILASSPSPAIPHRIEHVQSIHATDLPRLHQLGITASMQPLHLLDDMNTAGHFLGDRTADMFRFRSLVATGALLVFGSDAPVAEPNPFLGMHAARYRRRLDQIDEPAWHRAEILDMTTIVHAYTLGPAHATGWYDAIGSLAVGKQADCIVLDRDIFEVAADEDAPSLDLAQTQVDITIFNGEIVHRRL
jgi:predicted amidohydrolase YtcJ